MGLARKNLTDFAINGRIVAIIDVLLRASRAEKILFLADRRALRKQACDDGFKRFFPEEAKSMIHSGVFNRNSRLYVSTIQTFMEIRVNFFGIS